MNDVKVRQKSNIPIILKVLWRSKIAQFVPMRPFRCFNGANGKTLSTVSVYGADLFADLSFNRSVIDGGDGIPRLHIRNVRYLPCIGLPLS